MKKLFLFLLAITLSLCACGQINDTAPTVDASLPSAEKSVPAPTGYGDGEVQREMVYVQGQLYAFDDNGLVRLPDGCQELGTIRKIDNLSIPDEEFEASRLTVGDPLFSDSENVYVRFPNGKCHCMIPIQVFLTEGIEAFGGELEKPKTALPSEDLVAQGDVFFFRNMRYRNYDLDMLFDNFYDTTSCWYVDLSGFEAISQTSDERYICAMKNDEAFQLLLVCSAGENQKVACYVREDSNILELSHYELSDFSVQQDGKPLDNTNFIAALWHSHLSKDNWDSMAIFEDPIETEPYCVEFTSKDYPMLTYQLRYSIIHENTLGSKLAIDNIHETFPILISIPQNEDDITK